MPRRAKRIVLLLIAGAIVNVAVAWACALPDLSLEGGDWLYRNPRQDGPPVLVVFRGFGHERVSTRNLRHELGELAKSYRARQWWPRTTWPEDSSLWYQASGWPFLSMMAHRITHVERRPDGTLADTYKGSWGVPIDNGWFQRLIGSEDRKVLPLKPMWRGMIGNTLFYAGLLWLPFCGAPALRRAVRVRRGLCPRCAYPVGNGERCSECGTPLPARRASPR